jgi:Thiol-disulfide isomerase and thioredoxins
MKFHLSFAILLISLNSAGQYKSVVDSLADIPLNDMIVAFKEIDSLNLSPNETKELQYKKIKSVISDNPKNRYSLQFITWGKYLDPLQIDTLYSLLDSSYQISGKDFIKRLKIRSSIMPGSLFPSMILTDTLNQAFDISSLKGKIVFIDIWSSSCRPCREEIPQLIKLYEKYKDKGFTVIAISLDEDKTKWLKAIEKDQQPWQQFCELKPWVNNSLLRKWGIDFMPYNFLIDKDGKLIDKEITITSLEKKISPLLKD